MARQEQADHHAHGINGKNNAHDEGREAVAILVQDVQRRGDGGEGHRYKERPRRQPEAGAIAALVPFLGAGRGVSGYGDLTERCSFSVEKAPLLCTLASARAAAEAVAAVEGLRRGTLSIGIMQATDLFFDLPGLLASYRRTYPGVELKLQQASSEILAGC